jgi:hypothetical protein
MGTVQTGITTVQLDRWLDRDIREAHLRIVHEDLPREVRRGFDAEPVVVTDGVRLRDYLDVRPFGRIEFLRREGLRTVVEYAHTELVRLSPRGPAEGGHYAETHVVLLNGIGLETSRLDVLEDVKPGDKVQIVNTMPYARKIEGARANRRKRWSGRRGQSRQAPGGVYRKVQLDVTRRFGGTVFVDYRLEKLQIGMLMARTKGKARVGAGFYTYPVLSFLLKKSVW